MLTFRVADSGTGKSFWISESIWYQFWSQKCGDSGVNLKICWKDILLDVRKISKKLVFHTNF